MTDKVQVYSEIDQIETKQSDQNEWHSRYAYIFACIGSAVGLGNVWRFPYLVSKYGGGSFIIPYLIVLVTIGMPVLLVELSLGAKFRGGDVKAFGGTHPKFYGIGIASIFGVFLIYVYYVVLLGWILHILVWVLKDPGAFTRQVDDGTGTMVDPSFFYDTILQYDPSDHSIVGWNVIGAAVTFLACWGAVSRGIKIVSYVVYFTMPIPVVLLIILAIRGLTLDNAGDGIEKYLGDWTFDGLFDKPDLWSAAVGQCFFSLGVCMGIMTAYSSHLKENKKFIVLDEKIIALSDMAIAILGGFTIYSFLGHKCGREVAADSTYNCSEELYGKASMTLAFGVYPPILYELGDSGPFFMFLFFLCLWLLGIDSAFSMLDAVKTGIMDFDIGKRLFKSEEQCSTIISVVAFMLSLLICTRDGLIWLDIIDYFVNNWGMLFVGFIEAFALSWVYKRKEATKHTGEAAMLAWEIMYYAGIWIGSIMFCMLLYVENNENSVNTASRVFVPMAIFVCFVLGGMYFSYQLLDDKSKYSYIFATTGYNDLREEVNCWYDPQWDREATWEFSPYLLGTWTGYSLKYFVPVVLIFLFCTNVASIIKTPYGGYEQSRLAVGYIFVILMFFLIGLTIYTNSEEQDQKSEDESKKEIE